MDDETKCDWNDDTKCVGLKSLYTCFDLDEFSKKCQGSWKYGNCKFKECSDYSYNDCFKYA